MTDPGPLRAAFVGCGARAREHADAYRLVRRGRLVAACCRTREHVDAFCDAFRLEHGYTDLEQMLESERPDLLHVVTPPSERVDILSKAAEHGVPVVLVEKPIAIQGEDWRALTEVAATGSTVFLVNTQMRFHRRLAELRRVVSDGGIGDIRLIEASSRSTVLDQGVHLFDLASWFVSDREPSEVVACVRGDESLAREASPETSVSMLEFEGGARAQVVTGDAAPRVSTSLPFYFHKRFAAFGTHGFVHWTMVGWERFIAGTGYEQGVHDYEEEDLRAQALLTDSAFEMVGGGGSSHPTRLARSLALFNAVLGAYTSTLTGEPVRLPCDPADELVSSLREMGVRRPQL
jgi:predicted dehydrogenase